MVIKKKKEETTDRNVTNKRFINVKKTVNNGEKNDQLI